MLTQSRRSNSKGSVHGDCFRPAAWRAAAPPAHVEPQTYPIRRRWVRGVPCSTSHLRCTQQGKPTLADGTKKFSSGGWWLTPQPPVGRPPCLHAGSIAPPRDTTLSPVPPSPAGRAHALLECVQRRGCEEGALMCAPGEPDTARGYVPFPRPLCPLVLAVKHSCTE